jgi:hypothetical protein
MKNSAQDRGPISKLSISLLLLELACLAEPASLFAQGNPATPKVLQVGTYKGKTGDFSSIQAAVNAASPGGWILVAPGDYKEVGGVLITTPGIHLRGMDRNGVVVDGTMSGTPPCSPNSTDQNIVPGGLNGIEVLQVDGVSIENLTVCNFLGDQFANNGNEIWWNGGDGSGQIGMGSYWGSYLTASSTFFDASIPNQAQYGIFVSNAKGPGSITYSYASNMGDSGFYVGACADCNTTLQFVHSTNNPQGFSGSNSGGHLVIEDSEWDHNQSGIVPSSLSVYDPPSPQDGACPNAPGNSCTVIQRNYVHDNNNPNTPVNFAVNPLAGSALVGSGIDLSGGRNNTVQQNLLVSNGSWAIVLNDYGDYTPPPVGSPFCVGGELNYTPPSPYDQLYVIPPPGFTTGLPIPCYFPSFGNHVLSNVFSGNGFFGNPTNGDLANAALPYSLNNCFQGNVDQAGKVTSSPSNLQATCGLAWKPNKAQEFLLTAELGCASIGLCTGLPKQPGYPVQTQVHLLPIPHEATMQDPCNGVPKNSWCP